MESAEATPVVTPTTPRPPMSATQILDLRRRVLANEPVSDEELRQALEDLARMRGTAPAASSDSAVAAIPKVEVGSAFAAFMAKKKAEQGQS